MNILKFIRDQKSSTILKVFSLFFVGFLVLSYEACSKNFSATQYSGSMETILSSPSETPPNDAIDYTLGVIEEDCLTNNNNNYNTCVYNISPVSQEGKSINPHIYLNTDNSKYQKFAMKIETTSSDGALENKYFKMLLNGQVLKKTQSGDWKYVGSDSNKNEQVLQIHQYAHLNKLVYFINKATGTDLAIPKIPIEVHSANPMADCNAFYQPSSNSIEIGTCVDKKNDPNHTMSLGFDSEISIHEYGHAIFGNLSQGAMDNVGQWSCDKSLFNESFNRSFMKCKVGTNHVLYFWSPEGSSSIEGYDDSANIAGYFENCATEKGCSSGIHEGQADFHIFMLFPTLKGLGSTILDSIKFLADDYPDLVFRKNPSTLSQMKMSELKTYDFLEPVFGILKYEVHDVGEILSSIFLDVYKANNYSKLYISFFQELQKIMTGLDTYSSLYCKIKNLDKNLYSSKFIASFDQQYTNHGLNKDSCQ